jgi:hypothetical protein
MHWHPSKLPLHVAVPSEFWVPAQPFSSHDCCWPQNPGVADEGRHTQPSKTVLHVAVPSEFTVPSQLFNSQD